VTEARAGRPLTVDHSEVDDADSKDHKVPWRIFLGVGTALGVIAAIYLPSGEEAGTVMLLVASTLGLWCGIFLWRNDRALESGKAVDAAHAGQEALYLPVSSPWPLGIGAGLALVLNGLIIGIWFLVPGVMILAVSIGGFARQSRHRR
jgi:hypothetical protein